MSSPMSQGARRKESGPHLPAGERLLATAASTIESAASGPATDSNKRCDGHQPFFVRTLPVEGPCEFGRARSPFGGVLAISEPPQLGQVRAVLTGEPVLLTRLGPMPLATFLKRPNFFLLFPPLKPYNGVPLDSSGALDLRALRLQQAVVRDPARPVSHHMWRQIRAQASSWDGAHESDSDYMWGPPVYEV